MVRPELHTAWDNLPHNRSLTVRLQVGVRLAEMTTAQETPVCREGRGMGSLQDQVSLWVDQRALRRGILPPKHEHKVLPASTEPGDNGIRELDPPQAMMRPSTARFHRQTGVEQQQTLAGPPRQIGGR